MTGRELSMRHVYTHEPIFHDDTNLPIFVSWYSAISFKFYDTALNRSGWPRDFLLAIPRSFETGNESRF